MCAADARLFGRVTYETMEAAWRRPAPTGSSALDRVDWNAELVRGDLGKDRSQLKGESGKGLFEAERAKLRWVRDRAHHLI
jgi:hypothetical protein